MAMAGVASILGRLGSVGSVGTKAAKAVSGVARRERVARGMNRMRVAAHRGKKRAAQHMPDSLGGAAKSAGRWAAETAVGPKSFVKDHPFLAAGGAAGLGALAYDEFSEGVEPDPGMHGSLKEALLAESEAKHRARVMGADTRVFEERATKAMMRLAATNPQMYNEVLTGRKLPRGAMVFGGRPRTDLLELLAAQMAAGEYEVSNPEQDLARMLGGL